MRLRHGTLLVLLALVLTPEQAPLVTGRKITLSTNIPNRLMAITASSYCHSKLRSIRIKPTGTPRIWQICRRERHWAKFAEQIISRIKTIAISKSSGRLTQTRVYSSTMADMVLSQSLSWRLKGESFRQIDIGKHIEKTLARLFDGYMSPYFRFEPNHKLKVRALSLTNPKALPDQPSNYGVFQGTFDLMAGKWTQASAKKTDEYDVLQNAYQDDFAKHIIVAPSPTDVPENFTGSVFSSEQEKFDALDKMMNDVYQAVRAVTPPARFAKTKQEQIAWLKTRDVAQSVEEKAKLTESRIRTLQELLW